MISDTDIFEEKNYQSMQDASPGDRVSYYNWSNMKIRGEILEVYHGSDGDISTVKVKFDNGEIFDRPSFRLRKM